MAWLLKIKGWLYAAGAAVLAVLGFVLRIKYLENQRDKAAQNARIWEARAHVRDVEKKISKKRKEELSKSLGDLERKIEEKKFEDLDIVNPNDWD